MRGRNYEYFYDKFNRCWVKTSPSTYIRIEFLKDKPKIIKKW